MKLPRLPWGHYSERPRVCIVRQNDNYDESVQREADALTRAGFDVEVLHMRGRDGKGGTEVERGVTITALPAALRRQGLLSYCFDYAWFWALVASTLTVRHLRRPYAVVQVNTMPDLLVFSAIVPEAAREPRDRVPQGADARAVRDAVRTPLAHEDAQARRAGRDPVRGPRAHRDRGAAAGLHLARRARPRTSR